MLGTCRFSVSNSFTKILRMLSICCPTEKKTEMINLENAKAVLK